MKRLLLVALLLLGGCLAAFSQDSVQYTDASAFPVYGKAYSDDGPRYRRMPANLEGVVRDALWSLARNSAGLYIRFRTNAPEIYAHWTNTGYTMPHMTDVGTGGLDLYAYIDGEWKFVGSGFDWNGPRKTEHTRRVVGHMDPVEREYMLYLSLYDEVKTLELGVPEGYTLKQPLLNSPKADAPIVMYGTSILQGGCASRPGMAHTNILARRFNRTVINLGFSGNAFLEGFKLEALPYCPVVASGLVGLQANNKVGSLGCGEDFKTLLYSSVPALGTLIKTDNDLASGLLKVKSVSMTLAAVSDNGNGLALEKGKVTIFLVKNLVSHKIIPPLINWLILNCVMADK